MNVNVRLRNYLKFSIVKRVVRLTTYKSLETSKKSARLFTKHRTTYDIENPI